MLRFLLAVSIALLVAGCLDDKNDGPTNSPRVSLAQMAGEEFGKRFVQTLMDVGDKTVRSYEPDQGTQIEFNSDKGFAYLWYPGNRGVVVGHWKLQFARRSAGGVAFNICHFYNHRPHDSVKTQVSHKWQCRSTDDPKPDALEYEIVPGDPFDLEKWTDLPCILNKERGTIAQLLEKYRECKALPGSNQMAPLNSGSKAGG